MSASDDLDALLRSAAALPKLVAATNGGLPDGRAPYIPKTTGAIPDFGGPAPVAAPTPTAAARTDAAELKALAPLGFGEFKPRDDNSAYNEAVKRAKAQQQIADDIAKAKAKEDKAAAVLAKKNAADAPAIDPATAAKLGTTATKVPAGFKERIDMTAPWEEVIKSQQWDQLPYADKVSQQRVWAAGKIATAVAAREAATGKKITKDERAQIDTFFNSKKADIGPAPQDSYFGDNYAKIKAGFESQSISGDLTGGTPEQTAAAMERLTESNRRLNASLSTGALDRQKASAQRDRDLIAENVKKGLPPQLTIGQELATGWDDGTGDLSGLVSASAAGSLSVVGAGLAGGAVGGLAGTAVVPVLGTISGAGVGGAAASAAASQEVVFRSGVAEVAGQVAAASLADLNKSPAFRERMAQHNGNERLARAALTQYLSGEMETELRLLGGVAGAINPLLGAGKAAGQLATRILARNSLSAIGRAGGAGAINTALVSAAKGGVMHTVKGVALEIGQEIVEEGTQQILQNKALLPEGLAPSLTSGAAKAAVMGGLAGGVTAGGIDAVAGPVNAFAGYVNDSGDVVSVPDGKGGRKTVRRGANATGSNVAVEPATRLARIRDINQLPSLDPAAPNESEVDPGALGMVLQQNAIIMERAAKQEGKTPQAGTLAGHAATSVMLGADGPARVQGVRLDVGNGVEVDFLIADNGQVSTSQPNAPQIAQQIAAQANQLLDTVRPGIEVMGARTANRQEGAAAPTAQGLQAGNAATAAATAAVAGGVTPDAVAPVTGPGVAPAGTAGTAGTAPQTPQAAPQSAAAPQAAPAAPQAAPQAAPTVAPTPTPAAETPASTVADLAGQFVDYGGITGQVEARLDGYYVVPLDNSPAVLIEGGQSGQPAAALGVAPLAQQPNPEAVAAGRANDAAARAAPAKAAAQQEAALDAATTPDNALEARFNTAIDDLVELLGETEAANLLYQLEAPGQNFETLTKKIEASYYEKLDAATSPESEAVAQPSDAGPPANDPGPAPVSDPAPAPTAGTTPAETPAESVTVEVAALAQRVVDAARRFGNTTIAYEETLNRIQGQPDGEAKAAESIRQFDAAVKAREAQVARAPKPKPKLGTVGARVAKQAETPTVEQNSVVESGMTNQTAPIETLQPQAGYIPNDKRTNGEKGWAESTGFANLVDPGRKTLAQYDADYAQSRVLLQEGDVAGAAALGSPFFVGTTANPDTPAYAAAARPAEAPSPAPALNPAPTETPAGLGLPPVAAQLINTGREAAADLRERVANVAYGPVLGSGPDVITFTFDGTPYSGVLRGRNRDFVLTGRDNAADRAIAVRVLLDQDATVAPTTTTAPAPAAPTTAIAAAKALVAAVGERADIYALSGPSGVQKRVQIMSILLGKAKVPQAQAGVTALRDEFYRQAGITGITPRDRELAFGEWALAQAQADTRFQTAAGGEPVALNANVTEALNANDLGAALNDLATAGSSKMVRVLAERMQRLLGAATEVKVVDELNTDTGLPAFGSARSDGTLITISRATGMNEETLLHEAVHSASEQVLTAPESTLTAQQRAAKRELENLWAAAKSNPRIKLSPDADASLSEFVTEAMTNLPLQAALRKAPWTVSSAWDAFKMGVLKLLGITSPQTMLDATIAAMDTIFQRPKASGNTATRYATNRRGAGAVQTPAGTPPIPAPSAQQAASSRVQTRGTATALQAQRAGVASPASTPTRAAVQAQVNAPVGTTAGQRLKLAQPAAASLVDATVERLADSLLPVVRWAQALPEVGNITKGKINELIGSMYAAANHRDRLTSQAMEKYGGNDMAKALAQMLDAARKKPAYKKLTAETAQTIAGRWLTATYTPRKNALMLEADARNVSDAQAAFGAAVARNAPQDELDGLQLAIDNAIDTYESREFAINGGIGVNVHVDANGEQVGLAGGMNNVQAAAFRAHAEAVFGKAALQAMAKQVYRMNAYRLTTDIESGRVTPDIAVLFDPQINPADDAARLQLMTALRAEVNAAQPDQVKLERAREALVNNLAATSTYVPTSGSNVDGFDVDVLGSGYKAPNVAEEKRLKGRSTSLADDGITATLGGMQRSAAGAAWSDFSRNVEEVYNALAAHDNANGTNLRNEVGMHRTDMSVLTRLGDNFIIRGDYGYTVGDPKVLQALRKENVAQAAGLERIPARATQLFAKFATQYSLVFGPINMVRDAQERALYLRSRTNLHTDGNAGGGRLVDTNKAATRMIGLLASGKLLTDLTRSVWFKDPAAQNTKTAIAFREFIEQGGGGTRYMANLARDARTLTEQVEAGRSLSPVRPFRAGVALGGKIDAWVGKWNESFDAASSLAAYIALREQGMNKKAAGAAVLDMMNFRKTGTAMPILRAAYAFAQPAITGGTNMVRSVIERDPKSPSGFKFNKKGATDAAGLLVALLLLQTAAAALAGDDDDLEKNRYDLLDQSVKDRSLPLRFPGTDTIVKIPLGFGMLNAMNIVAGRIRQIAVGDMSVPEALGDSVKTAFLTGFTPFELPKGETDSGQAGFLAFAPTILRPATEVALNVNTFGNEIVRKQYLDKDQFLSEQGSPATAQFYADVAVRVRELAGIDYAPEQIKTLLNTVSVGAFRSFQKYAVDNPNAVRNGRDTSNPWVSSVVSGFNPNAVLATITSLDTEGQDLARERAAAEKREEASPGSGGFDPDARDAQVLELYDLLEEQGKGFRAEASALTRAGVEKYGKAPERVELLERRRAAELEVAREYLKLKK